MNMSRERAYDIAIAYGREYGQYIRVRRGEGGYNAEIPMEVIEAHLTQRGLIPVRERAAAAPASVGGVNPAGDDAPGE